MNRSARYLDELTQLNCAPDLLAPDLLLWPNAKEITESFGAFNAIRRYLCHWLTLPATAIVVGDGARPRTGVTLAMRTKWNVLSIDPEMRTMLAFDRVQRLTCIPERIEDIRPQHFARLVIVAVHSHAPLERALERFTADERAAVVMPCCYPQRAHREPDHIYEDGGVWSDKRTVKVWTHL